MTVEEAAELISRRCRGWVVDSIERLGEGDFCIAYLVNREWVFRFAKHEKAAASLLREACLLPLLAERFDVRIPSPQIFKGDCAPAFMGYRLLPGPALTRERYLRLTKSDRERCAHQVARFLLQLHSTDSALAFGCGVERADYSAQYEGLLRRARKHLFLKLTGPERLFVERAVAEYIDSQAPYAFKPVLLHGDLSPDHVLYDETTASVTGIIDFGDAIVGDPAQDIVLIYEDYGMDFLCRFLRVYEPGGSVSLLERMYRFYVLGAIEWGVLKAEQASPDLNDALAELRRLSANAEQEFRALLSATGLA